MHVIELTPQNLHSHKLNALYKISKLRFNDRWSYILVKLKNWMRVCIRPFHKSGHKYSFQNAW